MSKITIILLVIAGIGLVYFLKKRMSPPKIKKVVVVDPAAQEAYESRKKPDNNEKKLTLEERIELSWQFLVNIRDQVLNKFSDPDRQKVTEVGHKLAESGMRYQHDVDQEISIKQEASKSKIRAQSKNQDQPEGRSR